MYISDLDRGFSSDRSMLADSTKIGKFTRSRSNLNALQDDLDKVNEWAVRWQIEFNIDKCSVFYRFYISEGSSTVQTNIKNKLANHRAWRGEQKKQSPESKFRPWQKTIWEMSWHCPLENIYVVWNGNKDKWRLFQRLPVRGMKERKHRSIVAWGGWTIQGLAE